MFKKIINFLSTAFTLAAAAFNSTLMCFGGQLKLEYLFTCILGSLIALLTMPVDKPERVNRRKWVDDYEDTLTGWK